MVVGVVDSVVLVGVVDDIVVVGGIVVAGIVDYSGSWCF
jgi:hypothetical protein